MPVILQDPPEPKRLAVRSDPPKEKQPERPVPRRDITATSGDERDWSRYLHRVKAADRYDESGQMPPSGSDPYRRSLGGIRIKWRATIEPAIRRLSMVRPCKSSDCAKPSSRLQVPVLDDT